MSSFPLSADRFLEHYLARHGMPEATPTAFPDAVGWALGVAISVISMLCLSAGWLELAFLPWSAALALVAAKRVGYSTVLICAIFMMLFAVALPFFSRARLELDAGLLTVGLLILGIGYLSGWVVWLRHALKRKTDSHHFLKQFGSILTQTDDICLKEIDRDGRLLAINDTGMTLMEFPDEATDLEGLHGSSWLDLWETHAAEAHQAFESACQGTPGRFIGLCKTFKGKPAWWDVLVVPVWGRGGEVTSVLALSWDVTQARHNAQSLKTAHDEFDALLNSLDEGVYRLDHNWRFVQVNDKAEQLLRRTREELEGTHIWDLYPEEKECELGLAYRDVMYSGFPRHLEFYFRPFQQWHRVSAYPRPNGITVFFRNITADVVRVQQSQTTETRLRLTQEIGRFAEWQFDLTTRDLILSDQAIQLLDISPNKGDSHQDELLRQLHPDDRLMLVSALLDLTEGRETLNISVRVQGPTIAWRDFHFAGVLLRPKAHPQGIIVGCMQDVSLHKHRERRFMQAEAFTRSILDALPQLICVLDETGAVITVNQAWRHFIDTNPAHWQWPETDINYLDFCREMAKRGDAIAQEIVERLESLLSGTGDPFNLEFRMDLGNDVRLFHMFALLMDTEQRQILIVHEDVTETTRLQHALSAQSQRLNLIYEGSNEGLWEWIPHRNSVYVSERFIELMGTTVEPYQPFPQWLIEHAHPDEIKPLEQALEQHFSNNEIFDVELRLDTTFGWHWFRVRGKSECEGKTLVRFAGSLMDISVQRDLFEQLQASESRFREMVEFLPHVFWVYDVESERISYLSPAFQRIWGYSPEELYDNAEHWMTLVHEEDQSLVQHFHQEAILRHQPVEVEYRSMDAAGNLLWIRNRSFPFSDEQGRVARVVGIAENITEARNYQEQLFAAAHFDALSGLPNRVMFHKRLEEQCVISNQAKREFFILFIALDRLKWVEQCLGQRFCDDLISQLSARFQIALGGHGYLASLTGGEFAVLLSRENETAQCQSLIDALLSALSQHFTLGSEHVRVNGYIGVAHYPGDGETAEQLIKNAHAAVYTLQQSGRSGYQLFNQGLLQHSFDTLKLEAELNRAIEHKEFVLYYQPKVCISDNRVCGAEALIRWEHPAHGLVSPLRFISLLEETGLIVPVGLWCIDQALAQLAQWPVRQVGQFVMAVNLSLKQLQPGLVEYVKVALERHGIEPGCLELELTESIMPEPESESSAIITELKALGVRIAVDDFGTGYSTLGSLRSFVPDTLKIDRCFLNEMVTNASDRAIVKSVVEMAHALEMTVVAEGVESLAQRELLETLNCDQIQGYLISGPVPAAVFQQRHIAIR
jgi:diguanylate cyclase (GGDEF)-like protein/PAS domain S-box-containing protein